MDVVLNCSKVEQAIRAEYLVTYFLPLVDIYTNNRRQRTNIYQMNRRTSFIEFRRYLCRDDAEKCQQ